MPRSLGWYIAEQIILKVTLARTDPAIWRRVEVHSGLTLDDLHVVIQCVFNWEDAHLYQFLVPPGGKLTNKAMREAVRYELPSPDPTWGPFDDDEEPPRRSDQTPVSRVFTPEVKQIVYEYDFGDSWEHIVKLEKRTPGGDQTHVPVCLAGENAAPYDDMGGIPGFYMQVDALKNNDQSSEWYEQALYTLGKDFDETKFDLDLANKRLKRAFKPVKPKPRKPRKKKRE